MILLLDSGALIAAGKGRKVESIMRRWQIAGAQFVLAAPSLAEAMRGGPGDAAANRLVETIDFIIPTTERIARRAGASLRRSCSGKTIDAIIAATAYKSRVTDILTSDPEDMRLFAGKDVGIHKI